MVVSRYACPRAHMSCKHPQLFKLLKLVTVVAGISKYPRRKYSRYFYLGYKYPRSSITPKMKCSTILHPNVQDWRSKLSQTNINVQATMYPRSRYSRSRYSRSRYPRFRYLIRAKYPKCARSVYISFPPVWALLLFHACLPTICERRCHSNINRIRILP